MLEVLPSKGPFSPSSLPCTYLSLHPWQWPWNRSPEFLVCGPSNLPSTICPEKFFLVIHLILSLPWETLYCSEDKFQTPYGGLGGWIRPDCNLSSVTLYQTLTNGILNFQFLWPSRCGQWPPYLLKESSPFSRLHLVNLLIISCVFEMLCISPSERFPVK